MCVHACSTRTKVEIPPISYCLFTHLLRIKRRLQRYTDRVREIGDADDNQCEPLPLGELSHHLGLPFPTTSFEGQHQRLSRSSVSTIRALQIVFVALHQEPPTPESIGRRLTVDRLAHPYHRLIVANDERTRTCNSGTRSFPVCLETLVTRLSKEPVTFQQGNLWQATEKTKRENEAGSEVERYAFYQPTTILISIISQH